MKNQKLLKKIIKFMFILLSLIIFIIFILLINKQKFVILISHLSHKNELEFVRNFLYDFNRYQYKNPKLKKYFFDDKAFKFLEMLTNDDKIIQKRDYIIRVIASNDKDPNYISVRLATKEGSKIVDWIIIIIINKNRKYYIKGFQICEHFPRPPNVWE